MHELWSLVQWGWHYVQLRHVIDILLVTFLIYEFLRLVQGTRAVQMGVGLLLMGMLYGISSRYELSTMQWVLRNAAVYIGFAVIVLFQQEIRAVLTTLGNNIRLPSKNKNPFGKEWYDEIVLAATTLASEKLGALIVFEREVGLKTLIESGIRLDARISYDLLVTIFNKNTTLHDGAVIISNNRVTAACCFLPLTQNPLVSRELGTRHRSAIGVTEDSDAFAVIVSEETGAISFAIEGRLKRNLDGPGLRRRIQQAMEPWRSDQESEELEREEREREREIDELVSARKRGRQGTSPRNEEVQEGSTR
ncbi:MAG TPA: diadenylate cyclase CdaA [Blastocatellia bacterium]|nr:diadenylate cyclase CdaA [Blastocatellia bacterium]